MQVVLAITHANTLHVIITWSIVHYIEFKGDVWAVQGAAAGVFFFLSRKKKQLFPCFVAAEIAYAGTPFQQETVDDGCKPEEKAF